MHVTQQQKNVTDPAGKNIKVITNERVFIIMFDGEYANRLDILALEEDFVFDKDI